MLLKSLGDGVKLRGERLPSEILHTVLKGIGSGEDCRMRRPGQRNLREGALKDYAIAAERVQVRSLDLGGAVAAHVIGAEGVDRDKEDIDCRLPRRRRNRRSMRHERR